jgi:PAS domain S-box-containing protein
MRKKETSIQRKLMRVILVTCGTVLLLTCAAFFIYEFITYRDIARREISTLGEIVSANASASLAFDHREDADEILGALKAQKNLQAACLYDNAGNLFAVYPQQTDTSKLPPTLGETGYSFGSNHLEGFHPVMMGNRRVGTLYLRSDMNPVYHRFLLYGLIAFVFTSVTFIITFFISKRLQRSISQPVLELAETARIVSEQRDYSVRATKRTHDELGILTDAFNHMLTQIQLQSDEINALNANLEEKVTIRTRELQKAYETLKRQNEFIETIIDSSVDLIVVLNQKLEYVIVNKQAANLYNRERGELLGRNILELFPKLEDSSLISTLKRVFTGEAVHFDAYKSIVSGRHFETFFVPLKDSSGQTDRVLVIGHDITGIMMANKQLKQVNRELETSNRDLEQFAYVASHDLQEPLRKIQTFSELSERNIDNREALKKYLPKINSSAMRMSELIRAVLNYSRLTSASAELVPIDLNTIVNNIRTDLELVIEEKKADVRAGQLPEIKGNPLQIHQLFLNLISNSIKFSELPPAISITARMIPEGEEHQNMMLKQKGDYVELTFRDNGIGFDQRYAAQIFDIFQRLHPSEHFEGTGIGLALCKKIVENHNGMISVTSEPGKGTSFSVYLPLSPAFREEVNHLSDDDEEMISDFS